MTADGVAEPSVAVRRDRLGEGGRDAGRGRLALTWRRRRLSDRVTAGMAGAEGRGDGPVAAVRRRRRAGYPARTSRRPCWHSSHGAPAAGFDLGQTAPGAGAGERSRADALREWLDRTQAELAEQRIAVQEAWGAAEVLRQADAARRARGLLARLMAAWLGG